MGVRVSSGRPGIAPKPRREMAGTPTLSVGWPSTDRDQRRRRDSSDTRSRRISSIAARRCSIAPRQSCAPCAVSASRVPTRRIAALFSSSSARRPSRSAGARRSAPTKRRCEIVIGSETHRLDSRIERGLAGYYHHLRCRGAPVHRPRRRCRTPWRPVRIVAWPLLSRCRQYPHNLNRQTGKQREFAPG